MVRRNKWIVGIAMACVLVMSACGPKPVDTNSDGKLMVTVSILPQQFFVERIGGEHVAVNVMVAPRRQPAYL